MDSNSIVDFVTWYVIFVFSLTLHEGAHALVAFLGGDETAYRGGQVTLNPVPHIRREPFGTVIIPVLSFILSGWMMGWASAPYDPRWARRFPQRHAAMSAAGPLANFLLLAIAFIAIKILLAAGIFSIPAEISFTRMVQPAAGYEGGFFAKPLATILSITLMLNFLLFLFNLIPLPPLDGSGILSGLFPRSIGRMVDWLQRDPMFAIVGILIAWTLIGRIINIAYPILKRLLYS